MIQKQKKENFKTKKTKILINFYSLGKSIKITILIKIVRKKNKNKQNLIVGLLTDFRSNLLKFWT